MTIISQFYNPILSLYEALCFSLTLPLCDTRNCPFSLFFLTLCKRKFVLNYYPQMLYLYELLELRVSFPLVKMEAVLNWVRKAVKFIRIKRGMMVAEFPISFSTSMDHTNGSEPHLWEPYSCIWFYLLYLKRFSLIHHCIHD